MHPHVVHRRSVDVDGVSLPNANSQTAQQGQPQTPSLLHPPPAVHRGVNTVFL